MVMKTTYPPSRLHAPTCQVVQFLYQVDLSSWPAGSHEDVKRAVKRLHKAWWVGRYMGVSKNRGTPKIMVYNGKPYLNG